MSSVAIKLPTTLVDQARRHGTAMHRSAPKQLEYWVNLGKTAEENPDLPIEFIKKVLIAKAESAISEAEPFAFTHMNPKVKSSIGKIIRKTRKK
jgi:MinD-like ATPase involved in chromosome partitioning or flagellar assembly